MRGASTTSLGGFYTLPHGLGRIPATLSYCFHKGSLPEVIDVNKPQASPKNREIVTFAKGAIWGTRKVRQDESLVLFI